jgi:hypothetical protein
MQIVKYQSKPNVEAFIWAMWLMFLRAPDRKTGPGECVDLGEVGVVREKNWTRVSPYSPATRSTD